MEVSERDDKGESVGWQCGKRMSQREGRGGETSSEGEFGLPMWQLSGKKDWMNVATEAASEMKGESTLMAEGGEEEVEERKGAQKNAPLIERRGQREPRKRQGR